MRLKTYTLELAGQKVLFEFGKLAQQAGSSVVVTVGGTSVLATATMSNEVRDGQSFFPLMVDYEERLYAVGKIKGSRFIKREGRPTDQAILTARLIDRALRPLFPKGLMNDVQVLLTVLSYDEEHDPDMIAFLGASTVLATSDIPWAGPIAAARVVLKDGQLKINPSHQEREGATLDLIIAGDQDRTLMLDGLGNEVVEAEVVKALDFVQADLHRTSNFIREIVADFLPVKREFLSSEEPTKEWLEVEDLTRQFLTKEAQILFSEDRHTKAERLEWQSKLAAKLTETLIEAQVGKEKREKALKLIKPYIDTLVTESIVKRDHRIDGRSLTEIRKLTAEVGLFPHTHGSALFNRGETQVLSMVTLGAPGDEQLLDGMEVSGKKKFLHHYNFPPYSVGEVKPLRGTGRREIGHGTLAEKALAPVLPANADFPYTIRVVSEVLGSNGSSSMAATCGASLALMQAGVPLKKHVAGIAMGLASDSFGNYKVLTDLQDLEDGEGGMDFKIAGTVDGITAIQLDTKTTGLKREILLQTLQQAKEARLEILKVMSSAVSGPQEMAKNAPLIKVLEIDPDKIRVVIGPGGKMINSIIEETGVAIDLEDDGKVFITGTDQASVVEAVKLVNNLTREFKVGDQVEGEVTRIMPFGAFVKLGGPQEGLVHISKLANERINKVEDVVSIGSKLMVKVVEIDSQGRINLASTAVDDSAGGGRSDHSGGSSRPRDRRDYDKPRRSHDSRQRGR